MKKFRKIMAVLVAAVLVIAMAVPAFAATRQDASDNTYIGVLGTDHGVITVSNPKIGEDYTAYKLFDLASFRDTNTATTQHLGDEDTGDATEWYSYVISEKIVVPDPTEATPTQTKEITNPWWTFLTTASNGRKINNVDYAYAVSDITDGTVTTEQQDNAYFFYSKEKISLNGRNDYHIIKANKNSTFINANDDPALTDTARTDNGANDGAAAGIDYVKHNNKDIQAFAQEALKFASASTDLNNLLDLLSASTSPTGSAVQSKFVYKEKAGDPSSNIVSNKLALVPADKEADLGYYLVGTTMGTLASLDTTNSEVEIKEKNDEPGLEKKVLKKNKAPFAGNDDINKKAISTDYNYSSNTYDDAANWVANTDADIADYVQFRTIITTEQGMKNYKLHDIMEAGLQFKNEVYNASSAPYGYRVILERDKIVEGKNGENKVYSRITDYYEIPASITVPEGKAIEAGTYTNFVLDPSPTDGCDFEIAFQDANEVGTELDQVNFITSTSVSGDPQFIDIKDSDRIVVYYYAQVTSSAAIFGSTETPSGEKTEIKDTMTNTLTDEYQVLNQDHNASQRNENYTILTYGARSFGVMREASVTTYQFDVVKTRNDEHEKNGKEWHLLKDATFNLYKAIKSTDTTAQSPNGAYDSGVESGQTGYYLTKKVGADTYCVVNTTGAKTAGSALVFSSANKYLYVGDSTVLAGQNQTTDLVSLDDAVINVRGLEAGTYLLEEVTAPIGYDKLAYPIVITINPDANNNGEWEDDRVIDNSDPENVSDTGEYEGSLITQMVKNNGDSVSDARGICWKAQIDTDEAGKYYYIDNSNSVLPSATAWDAVAASTSAQKLKGVQIINTTGEELPSTGGMGTTVLYIVGGMMVILAGAYLFFSKRRNAA